MSSALRAAYYIAAPKREVAVCKEEERGRGAGPFPCCSLKAPAKGRRARRGAGPPLLQPKGAPATAVAAAPLLGLTAMDPPPSIGFDLFFNVFPLYDLNSEQDPILPCWSLVCKGIKGRFFYLVSDLCSNVMLIITGTSIGGLVFLVSLGLILFYISRKSDKEKETRLKIERFLAMYKTTKPTRYTYAGIKKITKRFKQKLGQGGFGSVYKGELPNGIPVAVKILEKSGGEGEEFINEVATIGRIHHVNIVRLLGFCSEGTRHALVYEFMPNESLEKFIFSKEAKRNHRLLSMEKLQEIALGIAQGMEYLHQGCNQRILHFDIKPHNILLDHNFYPKISDFGLAKLCARDHSIVTMTAARGTMGYIAPEIYSRNFGTVSYKSDVYSFGMLVLEMVGGRKNDDPSIESQSEIYFPEWVYDRLVHGQDLGLGMDLKGEEEEIAKKLATVALWCIQWTPMDRPSMTKVVQMLMGHLQSLQMPPKPFVSSSNQDNGTSVNEVWMQVAEIEWI